MDKEHWKRKLFLLYNENSLKNEQHHLKTTLKPPKNRYLYFTKELLEENVLSEQTKHNTYGNSKYYVQFLDKRSKFSIIINKNNNIKN